MHLQYKGEKPARIRVKPDRSTPHYTGISVEHTDDTHSIDVSWAPEIYTSTNDFSGLNFTVSVDPEIDLDEFRDHIQQFPPIPWNHTPKQLEDVRRQQALWLGKFKNLLMME